MQWDLGPQGLAVLGAMSLGFGVFAGLVVGKGVAHRLWATAITTVACFGVGLLTSEVLFGWATEEELQPNVDGLSRDEVLLSSVADHGPGRAGDAVPRAPYRTRGIARRPASGRPASPEADPPRVSAAHTRRCRRPALPDVGQRPAAAAGWAC